MPARVIQGFFLGGGMRRPAAAASPPPARTDGTARRVTAGPPRPSFAGRAGVLQSRAAPGRPAPAHAAVTVAQRFGTESFEIDPSRLRLANGRGEPLPGALLAKMEAAFTTDFSAVRVHIGPQASQIGALAFTTGNDLYFAPGQYCPDSVSGQQLIGHELAHVVQQRQGRVRASGSGSGLAVVQDRVLEAEADRLGMRAANHRGAVQAKRAVGPIQRTAAKDDWKAPAAKSDAKIPAGLKGADLRKFAAALKDKGKAKAKPAGAQKTPVSTPSGGRLSGLRKGGKTSKGNGVTATIGGKPIHVENMSDANHHAEALITQGWRAAVAAEKQAKGDEAAKLLAKAARGFSIDAWPCGACDLRLANTARDLECTITVTVTDDYGKYSKDHGLAEGRRGTIIYG